MAVVAAEAADEDMAAVAAAGAAEAAAVDVDVDCSGLMAPMLKLMGPRPLYYKTIYSKPMKLQLYRPPRPKPNRLTG
jgi:hypothetical protein